MKKTVTLDSNEAFRLFALADMTCVDQIEAWGPGTPEKKEWRALRKALNKRKKQTFEK